MSKIGKKLEGLFSAASFAEAGEFDTARELLEEDRKVLLVLTGRETDTKSLKYALSIARRTGAGLEALTTTSGEVTKKLLKLCSKEAGRESVSFYPVKKSGCIKEAVISYVKDRRDILCVVIESTEALNIDCSREEKKLTGIWEKLGCPLALVSEKTQ